PSSNTPSTLNNALTKYQYLIDIGITEWDLTVLNPNRKKFLSQKARRSTNQEIQRMNPEKRYPILIAFLAQNLIDVTDSVLDMFEAYLNDVFHKCRRSLEIYQQETVNAKDNAMATLSFVATMVADEKIPPEQIRTKVFSNISKTELNEAISVTKEILKPARNNFLSFLDNHFNRLRQFSGNFLKTLTFFSGIQDDNFLYAIEIVLGLQNGSRKKIPD